MEKHVCVVFTNAVEGEESAPATSQAKSIHLNETGVLEGHPLAQGFAAATWLAAQ